MANVGFCLGSTRDMREMPLHQARNEKGRRDRGDDPGGAARAGLAAGKLVRRQCFFQFALFVCSKHAFVKSQAKELLAMDGGFMAELVSQPLMTISRTVVPFRSNQGRLRN